jgi:hypothetical protein
LAEDGQGARTVLSYFPRTSGESHRREDNALPECLPCAHGDRTAQVFREVSLGSKAATTIYQMKANDGKKAAGGRKRQVLKG